MAGVHRAELNQSKETSRKEWGAKAKAIGHKPEHLHALAAEMAAHDKAGVEQKTAALQSARKTIESYGGDWKTASLRASRGGDAKNVKGIDVAAEILKRQHPEYFGDGTEHPTDRLFDMLATGNPKAMHEDEAYQQALDELGRHAPEKVSRARGDSYEGRGSRKKVAAAVDDVPFSDDNRGRLIAAFDADDLPGTVEDEPAGQPEEAPPMSLGLFYPTLQYMPRHQQMSVMRDAAERSHPDRHKHHADFADVDDNRGRLAEFYSPDQPRASDGKWTAGAGDEAAREHSLRSIRDFAAKSEPASREELEQLGGHLSRLTVKQLRQVRDEHGLRGSGPDKEQFVAKLGEKFVAHRAGNTLSPTEAKEYAASKAAALAIRTHGAESPEAKAAGEEHKAAWEALRREESGRPVETAKSVVMPSAAQVTTPAKAPATVSLNQDAMIRRAVEERPSRATHGDTGKNSFFTYPDGSILAWNDPARKGKADGHMVHSHSGDFNVPVGKSEDFAPHNGDDVNILRQGMLQGDKTASTVIMADGRKETLSAASSQTPEQRKAFLALSKSQVIKEVNPTYDEGAKAWKEQGMKSVDYAREKLKAFAQKYVLSCHEGNWK